MTDQPTYPYIDGDVTVLGPEIFASRDGAVISWRGENYTRTTPDNPVTSSNPAPCGHCSHPAAWHDLHEGCVGPNGIGGLGSGDCTCTRNPDQAAPAPPDTSWQPDETLDYGHLPPPAANPDAPLRAGVALPKEQP